MSRTETPVGPDSRIGLRDETPPDQGRASEPSKVIGHNQGEGRRHRAASLVAASIVSVLALVMLAGGGWALWKDRVDRDAKGFVSIGTTDLRTETHAIVGDLRGDGPSWLWGSTVLGDARVRATSQSARPLFIGIARTDDVFRYLRGAGYATIDSFEVRADTTHAGGAPSGPPSRESIWAASTQGTGRRTLRWTPRSGHWSVVFMNADAGAGVAVHGDASAKLPILPWVAGGLLLAAGALGLISGWVLVRAIRRKSEPLSVGQRSGGGERNEPSDDINREDRREGWAPRGEGQGAHP